MNSIDINERSQHLLKLLVERYIREGQPVGSKALAEDVGRNLSPATIRNIMADLEEAGYLISPHTSAGRVPTPKAYRLFVNNLLTLQPLKADTLKVTELQHQLDPNQTTNHLLHSASNLLSDITKLAGLITVPKHNHINLRRVEFLSLSQGRILTILVFNNKEVQNRIISVERNYTISELEQAANFINQHYVGRNLLEIRAELLKSMAGDKKHMNNLMQMALEMANKAFDKNSNVPEYVVAGEANLLGLANTAGIDRLQSLFNAFTQKHAILQLLDKCLSTDGLQIFIGKESGYDLFEDWSIVAAPYKVDSEVIGVLGVIGPTRMPYEQVISVVDVTAKLVSAALKE